MILAFLLALAQPPVLYSDPGDAPPIPDGGGLIYAKYVGCLTDPLEAALADGVPESAAERSALIGRIFASCADQRAATIAGMEAGIPHQLGWNTPAERSAIIAEIVGKLEQRVAFSVVDREEYLAMIEKFRACYANGGSAARCVPAEPAQTGKK